MPFLYNWIITGPLLSSDSNSSMKTYIAFLLFWANLEVCGLKGWGRGGWFTLCELCCSDLSGTFFPPHRADCSTLQGPFALFDNNTLMWLLWLLPVGQLHLLLPGERGGRRGVRGVAVVVGASHHRDLPVRLQLTKLHLGPDENQFLKRLSAASTWLKSLNVTCSLSLYLWL